MPRSRLVTLDANEAVASVAHRTNEVIAIYPRGSIVRCPRCGRNGVLERPQEASPFCLHKQKTELCSDGMRSEPTDLSELADEGDYPRMD